jgi:hypothetical protein
MKNLVFYPILKTFIAIVGKIDRTKRYLKLLQHACGTEIGIVRG